MSLWNGTRWVEEAPASPSRAPSRLATWAATGLMIIGFGAIAVPLQLVAARAASAVWVNELSSGPGLAPAALRMGDAFTVGYTTSERQPWALAQCYATDTTVLSGAPYADGTIWAEWFTVYPDGPLPQNFVIGESVSPIWTGGGANCTVTLAKLSGKYNGAQGFSNVTVLATTSFAASP
jgi:hypothetical protein